MVSASQSVGQSVSLERVSQSVRPSLRLSASQSVSHSGSHSFIQSVNQSHSTALNQKYLSFEFQFPLLRKIDYDPWKAHQTAPEGDL